MSSADRVDALEGVNPQGAPNTAAILRRRRVHYGITTAAIALLMAAALLGALTTVDTVGVDSAHVRAADGGYQLDVEYPTVARGGLATPLTIEVTREGGFAEPVTIGVDHGYLQAWDENALHPTPASETTMGGWLVWELDPPTGDTLRFTYDGRIEPAIQNSRSGRVAVLEANVPVVGVEFTTRVLP